jgi:hypothetical protein
MYIPTPSLMPLAIFDNIDTSSLDDLEHIKNISGGIAIFGPAAAYGFVWELGSLRLQQPGPRTVWGSNRDGDRRIMSSQAPRGYVGIISDQFWPIIEAAIQKVDFGGKSIQLQLEVAIDNASQKIANMVRNLAPVGETGDLRTGIQGLDSSDTLLDTINTESDFTLIL